MVVCELVQTHQHLPALACYITAAGTIDCLVNTTLLCSVACGCLFNLSVIGVETHTHTQTHTPTHPRGTDLPE